MAYKYDLGYCTFAVMRTFKLTLVSLFAITLFVTSCKSGSDKKTFTLQLPEGETMESTVSLKANASVRALGEVDLNLDVTGDMRYEAGKKSENGTPLTLTLTDMNGVFNVHQGIIQTADIKSDEEFDLSEVTDKYENKPVTVLMDDRARVTSIEGLDEILSQDEMDSLKAMTANAETLLGENFIERLVAFTAVLPEEPVAIGDKWEQDFDQEIMGLPVKLISKYQYKSSENGIARINVNSEFEMDTLKVNANDLELPFEGIGGFGGSNLRFLLKGTQTGFVNVNEETGWSTNSELKQKFKLEVRIGLMTLPIEMTNDILIEPR